MKKAKRERIGLVVLYGLVSGVTFFLLYAVFGFYISTAFQQGRAYERSQGAKPFGATEAVSLEDTAIRYRNQPSQGLDIPLS